MTKAEQITMAFGYAVAAHRNQIDRDGRPHIEHIRRVVARVQTWRTEPEMQRGRSMYVMPGKLATGTTVAATWLHDVVEDTGTSTEYLRELGFDPDIVAVVAGLTRTYPSTYREYIQSIAELPGGLGDSCLVIKQCDLEDNLERTLAEEPARPHLARRYQDALAVIDAELAIRGYDASRRGRMFT